MNISFCTVVLSLIQGIALNTGVLPLVKGGALHREWHSRQEKYRKEDYLQKL
jgi:hypothetical protein